MAASPSAAVAAKIFEALATPVVAQCAGQALSQPRCLNGEYGLRNPIRIPVGLRTGDRFFGESLNTKSYRVSTYGDVDRTYIDCEFASKQIVKVKYDKQVFLVVFILLSSFAGFQNLPITLRSIEANDENEEDLCGSGGRGWGLCDSKFGLCGIGCERYRWVHGNSQQHGEFSARLG